MKLSLILLPAILLISCAEMPNNSVGYSYDADSFYCKSLNHNLYQANEDNPDNSNQELYQHYCEPVANWRQRDDEGYKKEKERKNTFWGSLIDDLLY
jgi:hypothetical protein